MTDYLTTYAAIMITILYLKLFWPNDKDNKKGGDNFSC